MKLKLLLDKLTPNFQGDHDATCLKNTLILVLALLHRQTVCLNKLKGRVGMITGRNETRADSHYKRLIRFFNNYAGSKLWIDLICYGVQLLRLDFDHLIIDGTSWQRGAHWHHYLTLCIVYRGVAIPIYWIDLAKQGSSSYAERVELFTQAARHFKLAGKTLLADREYIGAQWFNFLLDSKIDFVIRSRDQAYFELIDRTSPPGTKPIEEVIDKVVRSKKPAKAIRISFTLEDGTRLWAVVAKNPHPEAREDFMILLTNRAGDTAYQVVIAYRKRWKIEHCFRHLKSNGFELEYFNLATEPRQRLLLAVVVFAYIVSVVEGLKDYARRVGQKVQGSAGLRYRITSIFRHGLDNLTKHTKDLPTFCRYLCQSINQALRGYRSINLLNV